MIYLNKLLKLKKPQEKIFVISLQRNGTKSTGQFFRDFGYKVAHPKIGREKGWSSSSFNGDFEQIFKDPYFQNNQVFEDDPWWCSEFYKYLFHKFPNSKFVLLERDPKNWFDSMIRHSNGRTLGNTYGHCSLYNRNIPEYQYDEIVKNAYQNKIDNLLELNEDYRQHYENYYNNRSRSVKLFFSKNDPDRLFIGDIEDSEVWQKLGAFFSIEVDSDYKVHHNKRKI